MYLSRLLIDLGDNPDRPRPGRLWLRNLYHVHQRLCMAFPSATKKTEDADFLKPFNPEDFGNGQVHDVSRKEDSGFLFRIDYYTNGRAVILVQSAIKPDWGYAFHNAGFLLSARPDMKSFEPHFIKGLRLRFQLVVNPTRRLSKYSPDAKAGAIGKRVPVPTDKLFDWLKRRGESGGFSIDKESTAIQFSYVCMDKRNGEKARLRSVRYAGVLEVIDPDVFYDTIVRGIGSAKAFGCGLLSVAPILAEAK